MLDIQDFPSFRVPSHLFDNIHNNINLQLDNRLRPDECGNFDDNDQQEDTKMAGFLSALILDMLRKVKDCKHFSGKLVIPPHLPDHVANDILEMAEDEPCGIRGCILDIVYDDGNICKRFGRLPVDPDTVTTFEVMVILGKESPKWFLSKVQSVLNRNSSEQTVLKASYKLVKNTLYRRNGSVSIKEGS